MGVFRRAPDWLREAIGLKQEDVPNIIPSRDVVSTLDVTERGWGSGQVQRFAWIAGGAGGAGIVAVGEAFDLLTGEVILQPKPAEQFVLWGLRINSTTPFPGSCQINVRGPGGQGSIGQRTVSVYPRGGQTPNITPDSLPILGPSLWMWCPPGWRFTITFNWAASGGGNTIRLAGVMGTYRSGFKVVP